MDVVAEGPLKFGSLYSNSSSIKVVEGIAIGTSHGRLNVESDKVGTPFQTPFNPCNPEPEALDTYPLTCRAHIP